MKHLYLFLLLPLLLSCKGNLPDETSDQPKPPTQKRPDLSRQSPDIVNRGPSPLFDSLTKDFNVRTFLADMQFNNSGGGSSGIYHFHPDREGLFYSYFGSSHFHGDIYGKVELTTYIYGDEIGIYNQQDQELIELRCWVNDKSLGKLDLNGQSATRFRKKPSCVINRDRLIILQENEQLLRLVCREDTIRAFSYMRVKNAFSDLTNDEQWKLMNPS